MKDGVGIGLDLHRALVAAGVVGLWEYRIDLGLVICDEAMSRLYGVDPRAGSQGVPPDDLRKAIVSPDLADAVASLTHSIQTGTPYRAKYRVKSDKGTLWVRAHAKPRHVHGRTVSLSGINMLATSGTSDVHEKIATCMLEVVSLCRQTGDELAIYFAEMLLQHVADQAAIYQIGPAQGTA